MKIVQINAVCDEGSTGKICRAISNKLNKEEIENYILFAKGKTYDDTVVCYSNRLENYLAKIYAHVFSLWGKENYIATKRLISILEEISPDIIHIHNIHNHNCNLEMLFEWIAQKKVKVIWTFHDCWAFTGYCTHYLSSKCEKWKTNCASCKKYREYCLFDKSNYLFRMKNRLFNSVNLSIVCPSFWMYEQVKMSFLREKNTYVIKNGIDLSVFKPSKNNIREKYGIPNNKRIILGVASIWGDNKGLDVFSQIARKIDNRKYQIIMVGTLRNNNDLPKNIILISKIHNQVELAKIYSAADIFLNPSREDTFPTVNIEALACGVPIITSNIGGCAEVICQNIGEVFYEFDIEKIIRCIERVVNNHKITKENCVKESLKYDMNNNFDEYINLYKKMFFE